MSAYLIGAGLAIFALAIGYGLMAAWKGREQLTVPLLCDACDRERRFVHSHDGRTLICWRCCLRWRWLGGYR